MQKIIPSLNGLRAISIAMVIAYHYYQHNYFPDTKFVRYIGMFLFNGTLGVNIFFVISGFLITTLLIKERDDDKLISLKNFYARRAIRIFPAYYFLILIYFVLQLSGYFTISIKGWASIIFFAKQFHYDMHETAHLWSLSVEEVFYLVWPLMFVKIKNKNTLNILIIILIFAIVLNRIYTFDFPLPPMMDNIFLRGDALLVGCLIAINYNEIYSIIKKRSVYIHFIIPLLILSVLSYNIIFKQLLNFNSNYIILTAKIAYGFIGSQGIFVNFLIGIIIIISINANANNIWFDILNSRIMNHIGKLSYSLYLWQQIFTSERSIMINLPLMLSLPIIYGLALFSYHYIEKPFFSLRKHFIS